MFNHPFPLQWGWIDSIVTKGIFDIHLNVSPLEKVELGLFFFISWGENRHRFWELPSYYRDFLICNAKNCPSVLNYNFRVFANLCTRLQQGHNICPNPPHHPFPRPPKRAIISKRAEMKMRNNNSRSYIYIFLTPLDRRLTNLSPPWQYFFRKTFYNPTTSFSKVSSLLS